MTFCEENYNANFFQIRRVVGNLFFQRDVPVRNVDELAPQVMILFSHGAPHDGAPVRLFGYMDQIHGAFFESEIPLQGVAFRACKNHVGPIGPSSVAAGDDMINGEVLAREPFSAILACEIVSLVDVPSVEFHIMLGIFPIAPKEDHFRHEEFEMRGVDEIALSIPGHILPCFKVKHVVFVRDHSRQVLIKKAKGAFGRTHMNGKPVLVQNKDISIKDLCHLSSQEGRKNFTLIP